MWLSWFFILGIKLIRSITSQRPVCVEFKSTESRIILPRFTAQLCHLLAIWHWVIKLSASWFCPVQQGDKNSTYSWRFKRIQLFNMIQYFIWVPDLWQVLAKYYLYYILWLMPAEEWLVVMYWHLYGCCYCFWWRWYTYIHGPFLAPNHGYYGQYLHNCPRSFLLSSPRKTLVGLVNSVMIHDSINDYDQ